MTEEASLAQADSLQWLTPVSEKGQARTGSECWLPEILCPGDLSGLTLDLATERHPLSSNNGAKPGLTLGHSTRPGHLSDMLCSFEPQDLCTAISTA